ncbi:MAG: hypothetical protein V3V49_13905 [Candidatus Krumholzibacteria bacterium]
MRNRIVALTTLTVFLALAAFAVIQTQAGEEKKLPEKVTATLSMVTTGGGCDKASGPFCCRGDKTAYNQAFEKVPGVIEVTFNSKTRQVEITYEKGVLSLTQLVEAAKKLNSEITL